MRFSKITICVAIGGFLLASVRAFPGTFTVISQPTLGYTSATNLYSPTDPDFTVINSLGPFNFSSGLMELSVPDTWATWSCPPSSESCTPRVLWTQDTDILKLTLTQPDQKIVGFELQPDLFQVENVRVEFFSGTTLVGTITRLVNGDAGARLFAAESDMPITSILIDDLAGDDFAIANLRSAPEPGALTLLLTNFLGRRRALAPQADPITPISIQASEPEIKRSGSSPGLANPLAAVGLPVQPDEDSLARIRWPVRK